MLDVAASTLRHLARSQLDGIARAADVLGARLLAGGSVYTFGTGHSRSVAMELAARAGGLSAVKELVLDDLVYAGRASRQELLDGRLERSPDAALALLEGVEMGAGDAMVIISHSGRNGATVEMALQARRRDLPVVAVTSLAHSQAVSSRHPGGQRLFEVATLVIDTGAPYADTAISLGPDVGVCSVSSFAGIVVAQALNAELVARYVRAGAAPPLLPSRNLAER
ncbi:MAG TPA: sugar isomerase domain-containing protein [Acidimicrobiales bacterium]|nr:sugar isomerase domain-containing protein [Acidimicrobiales bacterium]